MMRRLVRLCAIQVAAVGVGFALGWALGAAVLPGDDGDDLSAQTVVDVRGVDGSADDREAGAVGAPAGPVGRMIAGTPGADEISLGRGPSTVELGAGNDTVNLADDGAVDRVFCGPGEDVVVHLGAVDPLDEFVDCETFADLVAQP
jgi:hypothetical protein